MIETSVHGRVGFVAFNRPDHRNALTPEMLSFFTLETSRLAREVGALVIGGRGAAFCAGFDIALCAGDPTGDTLRALLKGLTRAIRTLRALPVPVVAAVQGAAVAGGCALLGGSDFVVTHAGAKFGYPVTRLGVSPAVSAPYLRIRVGGGRTRERMLDPGLISGVEARSIGLADECLDDEADVSGRAGRLAETLATKPVLAMRATRAWLGELEGAEAEAWSERALAASLGLVGGEEERALLGAAVARRREGSGPG